MLSEREMQLSDAHEGIVELAPDAPVGARYIDVVPFDPVIDVAITPNRPDALGVAGIARDLAARGLGTLKTPPVEPVPGAFPCPTAVYLAPDVASEACPLFVGRLIRGVRNGPSPQWLQDRLRAIGLRPISALVDITNYVTIDRNRPLHVFDADKVHGPITVRLARPGETLRALDGKDYTFDGSETLVCDANGPGIHRRRHGRPALRLHRGDHQRLRRGRLVRPAAYRPHRPPAQGQLRRPLPLRARRRPGVHAHRHGARDADDPRPLRRRALRGRDRRRSAAGDPQLSARPGPRRQPRRHGDPAGRAGPHPHRPRLRRRPGPRRHPAHLAPRRPGRGGSDRGDRPRRLAVVASRASR